MNDNNFYQFYIEEKKVLPAGQLYLGTFLAFCLFFSFFFGSLLFFIVVVIICIFIFLDKENKVGNEFGDIRVAFFKDYFYFGDKTFQYSNCKSFTFSYNLFGGEEIFLRFVFKNYGQQDLFINIPSQMHVPKIYDIIHKSVKEDKDKNLSITDQIVLKFF